MPRTMSVSDTITIAAPPDFVYLQVSDPTQMGRWSPENRGATVDGPPGPAHVGMEFVGHNKRGRARWTTRCVVTAADPGERFAFEVQVIGWRRPRLRGPNASWEYRFEPTGGGTLVTETWTDDRRNWPDPVAGVFDRIVTSGSTFPEFQRRNIARTLANLRSELEAAYAG